MDALATSSHRFVDIIILTQLPPNLVNRDDTGRPKTTTLGGVPRLAPSPQNFKLGLRRASKHGRCLVRSKWLPAIVVDRVLGTTASNTVPEDAQVALYNAVQRACFDNTKQTAKAEEAAKKAAEKAAKKAAEKGVSVPVTGTKKTADPRATAGLLLVTEEEINALVKELGPFIRDGNFDKDAMAKAAKRAAESCRRTHQTLFRSLFGRMVTNSEFDEHRDGALQVGFPLSAERARLQTDYFVAVDDRNQTYAKPDEAQGTAHIGERPFAGGHTILVQAQIDLDLLATNAKFESLTEATKTHRADIEDIVLDVIETMVARPFAAAAGQGNFRTSPRACLAVVRTSYSGCFYDVAPCLERPVVAEGDKAPSDVAADRVLDYLDRMDAAFGAAPHVVLNLTNGQSASLSSFLSDVQELVSAVLA